MCSREDSQKKKDLGEFLTAFQTLKWMHDFPPVIYLRAK